jgi:hypothetical protein
MNWNVEGKNRQSLVTTLPLNILWIASSGKQICQQESTNESEPGGWAGCSTNVLPKEPPVNCQTHDPAQLALSQALSPLAIRH